MGYAMEAKARRIGGYGDHWVYNYGYQLHGYWVRVWAIGNWLLINGYDYWLSLKFRPYN